MSAYYRQLGEGLPDRQSPGKNSFQTDPRQLKQWIAALPLANASATARLLYQSLREVNHLRIDAASRLAALEALRTPIGQVADTVDRQIVGSTFPLPPQKQQLGTVARDFQHEMALGYRTALFDLCSPEGKVPFLKGKLVALALQRAIAHLGAQLSKAYLLYATPPEGLWRTLHDLFRYAQSIGLDDKAIEDPLLGGADVAPRVSYMHALLLAISNPYRLNQKDIHESYLVTRVWAAQCVLRDGKFAGERDYAIPLDADAGPGYIPEERQAAHAAVLSFDTSALEAELDRQLRIADGVGGSLSFRLRGAAAVSVDPELVRRLMQSWQPLASRSYTRLPAGHQLDTLVGLHALHYHLAGHVDFETFVRRACGPAVHPLERERAASWTLQQSDTGKPDRYRARVLDQSLGGYRLEWDKADLVRARVGEIIGLAPTADDDEEADWMVGIIRWLRIDPSGRVDAGIELLARQARAAALRALDTQGHPKPPVRAVYLAGARALNGHAPQFSVLAPSVLERGALEYELSIAPDRYADVDEAETHMLPALDVLELTGSYIRLAPRSNGGTPATEVPAQAESIVS